jgi:hypothetical protein
MSVIENHGSHVMCRTVETPTERSREGYDCKTHYTGSEGSDPKSCNGRKLCYVLFSVVVCFGTLVYTTIGGAARILVLL